MTTLAIDRVSRWYGNVVAVNDVTMRIGPGITGLLGPNGAGKSTLIHMMGGFLAPSSGSVALVADGAPVGVPMGVRPQAPQGQQGPHGPHGQQGPQGPLGAPAGHTPAGQASAGQVPAAQAPTGQVPAAQAPAGQAPAGQALVGGVAPGVPVWHNPSVYERIGLVPEREGMYDSLTGWQFVLANAKLHNLADPSRAAAEAIAVVEMDQARDRRIATYSKGMRQRIKMATALVHKPSVLLLDEPFNGMDPRQRLHLMELLRSMGASGRTILFSSHILEEVEQIATQIEVLVAGRHAASGDFREIRRLMVDRPRQYTIRSSDDRQLASALIADGSSSGVEIDPNDRALRVQATDVARFAWLLPRIARDNDVRLYDVAPTDESLESVFSYLLTS